MSSSSQVATGSTMLREWNHELPRTVSGEATSKVVQSPRGNYYSFGDHIADEDEAEALAIRRMEEIDCRRTIFSGATTSRRFRAGHRFVLDHDLISAWHKKQFILTSVYFEGSQAGLFPHLNRPANVDAPFYDCNFESVEMGDIPFRPARKTPPTRIPGILSATIESPTEGDKYGYLEDDGSYRARLTFDLSNPR